MRLAAKCGIDVAPASIFEPAGKNVLLIERFDRIKTGGNWQRRLMVPALTMLEPGEMEA